MVKRVVYGKVNSEAVAALEDVNAREIVFLALLTGLVLWVGVWPNPILDVMHATVDNLLQHVSVSKLP